MLVYKKHLFNCINEREKVNMCCLLVKVVHKVDLYLLYVLFLVITI